MNAKLVGLLLAVCFAAASASIEREPVKVDHRNAGPKYDIDDSERTRVVAEQNPDSNQVQTAPMPNIAAQRPVEGERDQDAPMISIRRIFLVPVMSSPSSSSSSGEMDSERSNDPLRMFGMPPRSMFSPFSPPRHLFGSDDFSRPAPVNPEESQERPTVSSSSSSSGDEQEANERSRPTSALLDPIEMLMEAMRQALNPANMMPHPPSPPMEGDLNKEASSADNKPANGETGLEGPASSDKKAPQSFNSTKEDIVEIDGKKYLRKTMINRHVGDGIMFVTRRLIFSPLNETETAEGSSTTKATIEPAATEQPQPKVEKVDVPPTTSGTVSPAPSEPPTTTKEPDVSNERPTFPSAEATNKEDTTVKAEGIRETISKVERLMEKMVERKQEPTPEAATDKPSS